MVAGACNCVRINETKSPRAGMCSLRARYFVSLGGKKEGVKSVGCLFEVGSTRRSS